MPCNGNANAEVNSNADNHNERMNDGWPDILLIAWCDEVSKGCKVDYAETGYLQK